MIVNYAKPQAGPLTLPRVQIQKAKGDSADVNTDRKASHRKLKTAVTLTPGINEVASFRDNFCGTRGRGE